jgi:hypothetical protein
LFQVTGIPGDPLGAVPARDQADGPVVVPLPPSDFGGISLILFIYISAIDEEAVIADNVLQKTGR